LLGLRAGVYAKVQFTFFIIGLFFYLFSLKNRAEYIFYTRDEYLLPLLNMFSKRVVWEGHALPNNIKNYIPYLKKAHRVVVLTERLKKELIDLGLKSDNIWISPDAVDLEIFDINIEKEEARNKLNLPTDKIILGYTGSFKTKAMDKGINDILLSLKLVEDAIFVAVGGREDDIDFYTNIAKEQGVENRIIFLPQVDQTTLAIYQKAFDVLLMPFPYNKHYANYMSPLKMFEYMAAHRPIVTSDLPTIREVLNEETSFICKPDNPKDLARAINDTLRDTDLAKKVSDKAYEEVKKYTWDKRGKNILEFIK
jgi:glycosyltransferase involved in cell wall biosynthesis